MLKMVDYRKCWIGYRAKEYVHYWWRWKLGVILGKTEQKIAINDRTDGMLIKQSHFTY